MTEAEFFGEIADVVQEIGGLEGRLRRSANLFAPGADRESVLALCSELGATKHRARGLVSEFARRIEADDGAEVVQPITTLTRIDKLTIDPSARSAFVDGAPVSLSRKSFEVLLLLASDPHRAFTKEEISVAVWGYSGGEAVRATRTVDSHMSRLRVSLGGSYVENIWGVGWRLLPVSAGVPA